MAMQMIVVSTNRNLLIIVSIYYHLFIIAIKKGRKPPAVAGLALPLNHPFLYLSH